MTHDDSRRPTTDLTPSDIASASFRYVRRGYDIEEVDQFLAEVAQVVDRALSQATAMEARARAAVARLNDHSGSADKAVGEANAETITRTLLMAQRAADAAVEEARVDAERVRKEADLESERVRAAAAFEAQQLVATATARADELVETARANARQADEDERRRAVDEVASLLARREALVADVDQVEKFLVEQRERLRGAARQLEILCERIPGGLGAVPPPVLADSGEVVADASSMDLPDAADTPDVVAPPDAADVSDAADVPDPVDVPAVPVDVDDAADDHATTSAPAANEPDPRVVDDTAPLDREPPRLIEPQESPSETVSLQDLAARSRRPDHSSDGPDPDRPTADELGTLRLSIAGLLDSTPPPTVGEFDDTGEFEPTTELRLPPN